MFDDRQIWKCAEVEECSYFDGKKINCVLQNYSF